jgi:8-hydroxy-5-deazaflavin:NADPH oxidoreductase
MRIAIIGTGTVGGTLARRWSAAGHVIVFGVRDSGAAQARGLAEELGGELAPPAQAAASAEVVVLAIPGAAVPETAAALARELSAKTVVVPANDMRGAVADMAAAVAERAPGASVVRAFNTIPAEAMAAGGVDGFYACPDEADATASRLVRDCGLRPVRVGGPEQARLLDELFRLWAALAFGAGRGRGIAFTLTDVF